MFWTLPRIPFHACNKREINRRWKFKKDINNMEVIETVVSVIHSPPIYAFTTL